MPSFRPLRALCSGKTSAFQADDAGSIPAARFRRTHPSSILKCKLMATTTKIYKVNVMFKDGSGPRFEYIEAVNPPQARAIAENRFAGVAKIGSVNQHH